MRALRSCGCRRLPWLIVLSTYMELGMRAQPRDASGYLASDVK